MSREINIGIEEILLSGLSRLSFTNDQVQKIHDVAVSISDWAYFVRLANEHGIAALVYHNLEKLGFISLLPDSTIKSLYNFKMMSISRNAHHKAAVEELLGLLNRAGIKVVLIKGLGLELTIYGDAGLRQMTDVDILININDYSEVLGILESKGYNSMPVKSVFHKPIIPWTGKHLPSLLKHGISLDIHLELFGGKKNNLTKQMLETAKKINVGREEAYVPAPQLLLLYLVKHLNYHELNNESQLRLYADLIILIEAYGEYILNKDLLTYASMAGLSEILAQKLMILRDFLEVGLPARLDNFIDNQSNTGSINRFIHFLKSPKNNKQKFPGHLYRTTLREIPGIYRKVLFILGDIFPTFYFMQNRYNCTNPWKALIYYPIRFGKIFYLFIK